MLVPVDKEKIKINSLGDLVLLYQERLKKPLPYSEIMLMTENYQCQAFDLVFDLLREISMYRNIFDIGCGCGCLLKYLREKGFCGRYHGIDLVPAFIAEAQQRFADDPRATFAIGDFLEAADDPMGGHDVYVATSIFGFVPHADYMESVVKKAVSLARVGVIMTCNSTEHQVLPMTARTYRAADVLALSLAQGMTVDFKHRCIPVKDGHYSMIGSLIRA